LKLAPGLLFAQGPGELAQTKVQFFDGAVAVVKAGVELASTEASA
jgi:hypothetical protein